MWFPPIHRSQIGRACDRIRKNAEVKSTVTTGASVPDSTSGVSRVESGGKSDRLAVAQSAAEEALARYRAKSAARQKRYRERKRRGE